MANICDTRLKITSEKLSEEKIEEIKKYVEEHYAYCQEIYDSQYEEDDYLEISCGTRWNVMTDLLKEIAKKFRVNIRAIGEEEGCCFIQVVKVDEDGVVYYDEELDIG